MAPKQVSFYSYGNDEHCLETRDFIKSSGVVLTVRDIGKEPLSENEISDLFGNLDIRHFLNTLSDAYTKNKLDTELPSREEVIKMMAEDYTLIRRPIVKSIRLITVGCDKKKIAEMLQLGANGEDISPIETSRGVTRPTGRSRRSTSASR